jgi:glycosyltransferase involved in cell wall biosynthesis
MKLSVLMPVFNEQKWLEEIVTKVLEQKVDGIDGLEIIIVDDASTDQTKSIIQMLSLKHKDRIIPVYHEKNSGKGSAIQSAIARMTGAICIIQDADLEYDPREYPLILEPLISGRAFCWIAVEKSAILLALHRQQIFDIIKQCVHQSQLN